MSDPRPTARELAHAATGCAGYRSLDGVLHYHGSRCDAVTAAITADRAASDAREAKLIRLVRGLFENTSHFKECICLMCEEARAAIPPRSDR